MDWKFLLGVVGAIVAWGWTVFTWHRSQKEQRDQNEFMRKESLYRELLLHLAVFYKDGPKEGTGRFLEQYRLAWIYAPDSVLRALNAFVDSQKIEPNEEKEKATQRRDREGSEKLALLIAEIRLDLFRSSKKKTELRASDVRHAS